MKQELTYRGRVIKGDLIEIYAKAIANLGPLNYFYDKSIDYNSPSPRPGMQSYHLDGTLGPQIAYIARQLMDANDPVGECTMTRTALPYCFSANRISRQIKIDNRHDRIHVEVEDSSDGIRRVKKLLDDMFNREPDPVWKDRIEFLRG